MNGPRSVAEQVVVKEVRMGVTVAEQVHGNILSLYGGAWDSERIKKAVLNLHAKKLPGSHAAPRRSS